MPFLRVLNFLLGFCFLFLASSAGFFLGKDSSYAILQNKELLASWVYILQKSSHAHTNLFGLLHIAFGSTITSSSLSFRLKFFQTGGIFLGGLAMSVLLYTRSLLSPVGLLSDALVLLTGAFLSLTLLSLALHIFGLGKKLLSFL